MTDPVSVQFRDLIARAFGLAFDDGKTVFLGEVLFGTLDQ